MWKTALATLTLLCATFTVSAQNGPVTSNIGLLKDVRPKMTTLPLNPDEKLLLAKSVQTMLEAYPNVQVKVENFGVNPKEAVAKFVQIAPSLSDNEFHYGLSGMMQSFRDGHTTYSIPGVHSCFSVVTPYSFDFIDSPDFLNNPQAVIVSYVANQDILALAGPDALKARPGDQLVTIDGQSFANYSASVLQLTASANSAAAIRKASAFLSSRGGSIAPPPPKDEVEFVFANQKKETVNVKVPYVAVGNPDCIADQLASSKSRKSGSTATSSSIAPAATKESPAKATLPSRNVPTPSPSATRAIRPAVIPTALRGMKRLGRRTAGYSYGATKKAATDRTNTTPRPTTGAANPECEPVPTIAPATKSGPSGPGSTMAPLPLPPLPPSPGPLKRPDPNKIGFVDDYARFNYTPTNLNSIAFRTYNSNGFNLGVIQINSFSTSNFPNDFLNLIANLLTTELKDTDGLLFDVRANGGGSIQFPESIPQFFVQDVVPGAARAVINPVTKALLVDKNTNDGPKVAAEFKEAFLSAKAGSEFSGLVQFTSPQEANRQGQLYFGPVGVLNNAACYSSCDLFSAAMQDSGAAVIFGEDAQTGGGGANLIQYPTLRRDAPKLFPALPFDASIGMGWRQSVRAGRSKGKLIETIGIKSDVIVRPSAVEFVGGAVQKFAQFDKIAAILKEVAQTSCGSGLQFETYSPVVPPFVSNPTFPFTAAGFDKIELRNAGNKTVGEASIGQSAKGNLVSSPLQNLLPGRADFTIYGFKSGKQVMKTSRFVNIIPGPKQMLQISPGAITALPANGGGATGVYNKDGQLTELGWKIAGITASIDPTTAPGIRSDFFVFLNVAPGCNNIQVSVDIDSKFAPKTFDGFENNVGVFANSIGPDGQISPKLMDIINGTQTQNRIIDVGPLNGLSAISFGFINGNSLDKGGIRLSNLAVRG
ncbi:hypothetical protein DFS34DRAFT_290167 [Phlyctochytrium arcticum]|nr:hypothetical protein DFS34DRAFT_290167 [Phlyctochytrium arcticum]